MLCSEPRPVPGIPTQLENERAKAPTLVVYNLVLYSTARLFSYCGEILGLRKVCGELCQEVERVRTSGGQEVLHCNEFQSLTLTTLYRHIVGICRTLDRLHICLLQTTRSPIVGRLLDCVRIVVNCVKRWKD